MRWTPSRASKAHEPGKSGGSASRSRPSIRTVPPWKASATGMSGALLAADRGRGPAPRRAACATLAGVKALLESLRFLEQVKSPNPRMEWLQRAIDPAWKVAFGGCTLLRDPAVELDRAGFEDVTLRSVLLPLNPPVRDGVMGTAVRG